MIASPSPGQLAHQPVDLRLGPDVHALRRLVEDEHGRLGRQPARRATFCWLPPERFPTGVVDRRRLDPEPLDEPRGEPCARGRSRAGRSARDRRGGSPAWCWPPPTSRGSRRAAAGPRGRRRCPARRPGRGCRSRPARRAAGSRPRRPGVRPKSTRASSVRPAPTSPARPRISPARTCRLTPCTPDARQPSPRTSSTTSPCAHRRLREDGRQLAADHHADQFAAGHLAHPPRADERAVAQGRHAVGDLRQLLQPVRDVDDPDAVRLQLADDAEQVLDLLCR